MENKIKTQENSHSSEVTAVINILTKNGNQENIPEGQIEYTIQLVLVGAAELPPYLPKMNGRALLDDREAINQEIQDLNNFSQDLVNPFLEKSKGKKLLRKVQSIGRKITDYVPELQTILCDYLPKLESDKSGSKEPISVENIIFLTDDIIIPWSWACYRLEGEADYEFIAQRKSCGTLIVDKERFVQHIQLSNYTKDKKQNTQESSNDMVVVDCDFHVHEDSSEKVGNIIDLLNSEPIKVLKKYGVDDWRYMPHGDSNSVIGFLSDQIEEARIIHFSCDVINNEIVIDPNRRSGPDILRRKLHPFSNQPLVTLHGCYLHDQNQINEKQLTTVFLEKGASGCLVGLLPAKVNPVGLYTGPQSIVYRFYQYVLEGNSFGRALFLAKNDFRNHRETEFSPMWLFYELYGDPRSMLSEMANRDIQTANRDMNKIITKVLDTADRREKKMRVFFSYSRIDFDSVNPFYEEMKQDPDFEPFIDLSDIELGIAWERKIEHKLQFSNIALVFISQNSANADGYAFTELQKTKAIMDNLPGSETFAIPCLLDDEAQIPNLLRHINQVKLFDNSETQWNRLMHDLKSRFFDKTAIQS